MATKSTVPTVANGDSWSAAQHNTYLRDNIEALWPYTTAGDMAYASAANQLARLAAGADGSYLESNGASPQWTKLYRYMGFLLNTTVALSIGDDAARFRIPAALNGWKITSVAASRKSGTGIPTIQIRNVTTAQDILSTRLTIDSGETDSSTAATPAVINTTVNTVSTGQQFAIDVDDAGTSTLFMFVEIGFSK